MSKLTIAGGAAVLTSTIKTEDLNKLAKFKPAALKLVEKDGDKKNEIFAACVTKKENAGSISSYGVTFNATSATGAAQLTISLPNMEADKIEAYVKDTYGYALLNLNKLEAQVSNALENLLDDFAAMNDSITVLNVENAD